MIDDTPHDDTPHEAVGGTSDGAAANRSSNPQREPTPDPIDLARIEQDLAGVEAALRRLDDGTYWTDENTGEPIPDQMLADDPVARRAR